MKYFKTDKSISQYILILVYAFVIWNGITNFIQSWKCDDMTSMQLLKRWPNTIILDFKECN